MVIATALVELISSVSSHGHLAHDCARNFILLVPSLALNCVYRILLIVQLSHLVEKFIDPTYTPNANELVALEEHHNPVHPDCVSFG